MKVNLFDKDIELNKKIIVTLDGNVDFIEETFKDCWINVSYAQNWKDFCRQVKENYPFIITPLTSTLSSNIMELGYDLFVFSNNKYIQFSELLNGNVENSFHREIRPAQNWEKMLYGNCFDIDVSDYIERS